MSIKQFDYSRSYGFAHTVVSAVNDPEAYDLMEGILPDFFEFKTSFFYNAASKPQKDTLLHRFIKNINYFYVEWATGKLDGPGIVGEFEGLVLASGLPLPAWFNENDVRDYLSECDSLLEQASEIVTESTFQLLFADRNFLFLFAKLLAEHVKKLTPQDHTSLKKLGVFRRPKHIPVWLKNAVFHRDKGRCQICHKDLTNLLVPVEDLHYDHMLPLELSGTNDPSNFQLLCKKCNTSKGAKALVESKWSYTYW